MTRRFLMTTAFLTAFAGSAMAGSAPVKIGTTPDRIAETCAAMGSGGEAIRFGNSVGCRNTVTGGAITCSTNGPCNDYFADPRYSKVKAALGGQPQQMPIAI